MTPITLHIAVLTGDLVASTRLPPGQLASAFDALADCAALQADWHRAPLRFTRQRGDGWQVVLARPAFALRSALAFRAALRSGGSEFDSYISIAEGPVAGEIGPDLNAETAEVFVKSGDGLESIKRSGEAGRMTYQGKGFLNATTVLADHISQHWTPAQAAAILPFLAPGDAPSYTEAARGLGKSRQAVTKALDAAGYPALKIALQSIEAAADD
ncbi:MarR family transcriptional regulator [Thalassovita aquimarina]|uniref:MarR family transcriptional regulator n=1 Tax=Thalassovita aquimarina TaxID=2785917 RepID=A0ABS5HSS9_9RHOB|nr:MarR family transcriptional regulator [Thalassovita aquimarina]MBR9652021.1 MarR family transcriptional regulator [Thalassovita aquimarina]